MGTRSREFISWLLIWAIVVAIVGVGVVVFNNVVPLKTTITVILHTEDVNEFRVFQRKCLAKNSIVNVNNYDGIGAWRVSCSAWEEKE